MRPLLFIYSDCIFLKINSINSQNDYTGKVVDPNNLPIEFANIIAMSLPDSSFIEGTTTDENGMFKLSKNNKIKFLEISYVGYDNSFVLIQSDQLNYSAANCYAT
ncbi:MAG: hypothetical protein ACJAT4_003360 [Granulosicoccus sp.]